MGKIYTNQNVYDASQSRLEYIFNEFENVLVAFSGGKDSSVCLNMVWKSCQKQITLLGARLQAVYIDDEHDRDYGLYKLLITRKDEEKYFYGVCRRIQNEFNTKQCEEVLSYLKCESGSESKTETEDEALVAVRNGVVNEYADDPNEHFIDWKEARARGYVFTSKWYTDYNPNAPQPIFHDTENNRDVVPEDILFDIGGDAERVEAIKAAMHAVLRPNWRVEAAMLLVDPLS